MFTDTDPEIVGFDQKRLTTRKLTDVAVSMECTMKDSSTQVPLSSAVDVQTENMDSKNIEVKVDEDALLKFLRRVAPKIEEELKKCTRHYPNADYVNLDETDIPTNKVCILPKHNYDPTMVISRVSWNCDGDTIAASLVYNSHENWCKHSSYILIYKTNKDKEFGGEVSKCFEVNTCITDLKYHPTSSQVLAISTKEGKVKVYNLGYGQEKIICLNYEVLDSITQISWTKFGLAVAGSDGYLAMWSISLYYKEDQKLSKKYVFQTDDGVLHKGICCFDFSTVKEEYFVVVFEGGILLGCSTHHTTSLESDSDSQNPVIYTYEISYSVVNSIQFSPVVAEIFATSSINDNIRIYSFTQKVPIQIVCPTSSILGMEWNSSQKDIIKTWGSDGSIHYYNFIIGNLVESLKLSENQILSVSSFSKAPKQDYIVADSEGEISIWQSALQVKEYST